MHYLEVLAMAGGRHGGGAMFEVFVTFTKWPKMARKTLINGVVAAPPLGFRQCCQYRSCSVELYVTISYGQLQLNLNKTKVIQKKVVK